jgi:hypothetical protein
VEPTPELVEALYREKVLRARRMTPQRRVEVGAELSDVGRQMMREAIRRENPLATAEQVRQLMRRRIELARRLDDTPLPVPGNAE